MPSFGERSHARLATCHRNIRIVMDAAIRKGPDFTILCGHRSRAEQNELYQQGRTTPGDIVTNIDGLNDTSKHNETPSLAIDIAPYPIDWNDTDRFKILAGYILGVADTLSVPLRWGGDWDRDYTMSDERFIDLPHFELTEAL